MATSPTAGLPAPLAPGAGRRPDRNNSWFVRALVAAARNGLIDTVEVHRPHPEFGARGWHLDPNHTPTVEQVTVDAAQLLTLADDPDQDQALCPRCLNSQPHHNQLVNELLDELTWLDAADAALAVELTDLNDEPAQRAAQAAVLASIEMARAPQTAAAVDLLAAELQRRHDQPSPAARLRADVDLIDAQRRAAGPDPLTLGGVPLDRVREHVGRYCQVPRVLADAAAHAAPAWGTTVWAILPSPLPVPGATGWGLIPGRDAPFTATCPFPLTELVRPRSRSEILVRMPACLVEGPYRDTLPLGVQLVHGTRGNHTADQVHTALGLHGRGWRRDDDLTGLLTALEAAQM